MDLYLLDNLYRRVDIIDDFISLIWTERYNTMGDFEVKIAANPHNRSIFSDGNALGLNESSRVMIVENVEEATDREHGRIITAKGRSLELILTKRVFWPSLATLATTPYKAKNTPSYILDDLFVKCCVTGTMSVSDRIPLVSVRHEGAALDTGEPEAAKKIIDYDVDPQPLYDIFSDITETFDLGYRLQRLGDTGKLELLFSSGTDRTTSQMTYPHVMFSSSLDSLEDTRSFMDTTKSMNVAYVFSPVGNLIVAPEFVDPNIAGWDREVIPIKADDIKDTDKNVANSKMLARGRQELLKYYTFRAFDGEIQKYNPYVYGKDYNMGDIVEIRNDDGYVNRVRVTEQIFSSDREGDKSYPTLSVRTLAIPGSWLLWNTDKVWADMTTEQWAYI